MAAGRVSHAYLFSGPRHVGKRSLAIELAKALNCTDGGRRTDDEDSLPPSSVLRPPSARPCGTCRRCRLIDRGVHPEVRVVGVQAPHRVIRVADVGAIQSDAALLPADAERKVYVIEEAELLHPDAAARLLKTLEEPPPSVVLILTAVDPEAMLPTLVSRCQHIRLTPLGRERLAAYLVETRGLAPERAALFAALADGSVGGAIHLATDSSTLDDRQRRIDALLALLPASRADRLRRARELADRWGARPDEVRATLEEWVRWWRDVLLVKHGLDDRVANLDQLDTARRQAGSLAAAALAAGASSARDTLQLLDENVNVRLALDVAFLDIPRVDVELSGTPAA
ncbi:MAG: hypothetical protein L0221_16925 [Chloroflexi bacterium]|nr:hypothetical protein [Chloroflexota bacterium]